ncbi:hypothetical protein BMS3Bbin11_00658 [bacterium BMS3Bbin11]|nr:hypothetical protein BMS3Abin11_00664 [bacterium BMS3Abin11]GBE45569.1 hypothetical protein BMS3Bbin11_00658 [bacterium BMS3Bbin11]GMT39818.1 MAG: hypothetical protein IEMM0001_0553 [bacterium]
MTCTLSLQLWVTKLFLITEDTEKETYLAFFHKSLLLYVIERSSLGFAFNNAFNRW